MGESLSLKCSPSLGKLSPSFKKVHVPALLGNLPASLIILACLFAECLSPPSQHILREAHVLYLTETLEPAFCTRNLETTLMMGTLMN
jgi:hypothetical protein